MWFHTWNWKHYGGTEWLWWPTMALQDIYDPWAELGNHWSRMREDRGRTTMMITDSTRANLHWLQEKETNTIEWERVKVLQIVGFTAASPCGMWMQTFGFSQCLLVTNSRIWWKLSARSMGKGNQRTNLRKTSLGQLQCASIVAC